MPLDAAAGDGPGTARPHAVLAARAHTGKMMRVHLDPAPARQVLPAVRRRSRWRTVLLCALAVLVLQPASARTEPGERWVFDPARSRIDFALAALGIVPVDGRFERFAGEAWRDPVDGLLRVGLRIEAGSLSMRQQRYTDWARSPEFFDVRSHPLIEFRSDPIPDGLLGAGGEITGRLQMRGIERSARFEIAANDCTAGVMSCTLKASGEINRNQFGMRSRRAALSSRVRLDLSLHTLRVPVPPLQALPSPDQPAH
jgi:polyisoprenoid-binding protein YceI